jgi:hypothetical protein
VQEDPLGGRGAADVAEANHEYALGQ